MIPVELEPIFVGEAAASLCGCARYYITLAGGGCREQDSISLARPRLRGSNREASKIDGSPF